MSRNKCYICKGVTKKRKVKTRSKKIISINHCKICDYEFFPNEKKNNLIQNKLDKLRLKSAGMKLINRDQDFMNGVQQSKKYVKKHLKQKKMRILDIGCSWGYFLYLAKKRGHECYGVELNYIRRKFVNNNLKINCLKDVNKIKNLIFDKIFLFYSLEYIQDPLNFLIKLRSLLSSGGEIIIYTPNKNDHINSLLSLKEYKDFFYEENSINYFSLKSMKKLCKKISKKHKIELIQGYSFINLINWFFHKKPFSSRYVGEDKFVEELNNNISFKKLKYKSDIILLKKLTYNLNNYFKKFLVRNKIANIIVVKIR